MRSSIQLSYGDGKRGIAALGRGRIAACRPRSREIEMPEALDAVVVGAGPNGLTAAAFLARHGLRVRVLEAADTLGGGLRSRELTLPGFVHDCCSAVHTMGCLSPAFAALELERRGLEWCWPKASVAHPLDDQPAVLLETSVEETVAQLGADAGPYTRLVKPLLKPGPSLFGDLLAPPRIPTNPLALARFAWLGLRSVEALCRSRLAQPATRALLAGCAAHAVLPLDRRPTAAFALTFLLAAHTRPWPVARGGSGSIASALVQACQEAGVELCALEPVKEMAQLPPARAYLFDLAPKQVADIAHSALPARYVRALRRYRMGPGVFKLDWALSSAIPWSDPRCQRASTLHVGGSFDEIASAERCPFDGKVSERPFLIVAQQSLFDTGRAPTSQHTGYAYCHVPAGCSLDQTEAVERQMERFAPGFRQTILARHKTGPAEFEAENPSYVGGAHTGGTPDLRQLLTRPTRSLTPYATPNPAIFHCSQSTPPGGGVHGMCGYHAARSVLRRRFGVPRGRLP